MPDDKFWRAIPTWALDRQRADDEADSWAAQKRSDIADQWAKLMRQDTAARLAEMGYFPDGRHIDDIPPKTFEPDLAEPSIAPKAMGLEAPGAEVAPQDQDGMDWQVPDIPPPAGVLGGMGRFLPPPPINAAKPVPPSKQQQENVLAGEAPLQTPQDYVGEASRLVGAQMQGSPAAVAGFGIGPEAGGLGHEVSQATQRAARGDFAALGTGGLGAAGDAARSGLGAAAVHAAGVVPAGGGGSSPGRLSRPIKPLERNFLRDSVLTSSDDSRPEDTFGRSYGLPNTKSVWQQSLSEILPETSLLYHETSIKNARALLNRVEAGPRSQNFWVSDNPDLALGQGGRGIVLEIDPALANGNKSTNPAKALTDVMGQGAEYLISKTLRGAVTGIIASSEKDLNRLASDPLIAARFLFDKAESVPGGIRIPRRPWTGMSLETPPEVVGSAAGAGAGYALSEHQGETESDEQYEQRVAGNVARGALGSAAMGSYARPGVRKALLVDDKSSLMVPPPGGSVARRRVRDMLEATTQRPPTSGLPPTERAWRAFVRGWTDERVDLNEQAKAVARVAGRALRPEEAADEIVRLNPAPAAAQFTREALRPVFRDLEPVLGRTFRTDLDEFLTYHDNIDKAAAIERRAGLPAATARQFSGDVTVAQSRAGLAQMAADLAPAQMAALQAAGQRVWDFSRNLLRFKFEAGIIDRETFDILREQFPHYVPARILDYLDHERAIRSSGGRIGIADQGIRTLTEEGTIRQRQSPVEALVASAFKTFADVQRNRAFNAIDRWRGLDPMGFGTLVREVPDSYSAQRGLGEAVLTGFRDGERVHLAVPYEIAQAVTLANRSGEAPAEFQALMGAWRGMVTGKNPLFIGANAASDAATAITRMASQLGGIHRMPEAIAALVRGYGETLQGLMTGEFRGEAAEYLKAGGGVFGMTMREPKDAATFTRSLARSSPFAIRSAGDVARAILDVAKLEPVGVLGERIEMAPRVASYMLAKGRRGLGEQQAAIAGRDVTLDFQRAGSYARMLNTWIPFFNVGAQAGANLFRLARENPKGAALTVGPLVATPVLMSELWNHADPQRAQDYADVPDYIKRRSIVVMSPFAPGIDEKGNRRPQFKEIPLRELMSIAAPLRATTQQVLFNDPQSSWREVALTMLANLTPFQITTLADVVGEVMPQPLAVGAQLATGQDIYRDRPIATERADERASALSKLVADSIGGRPSEWEFAIRNMLGTYAQMGLPASDLVAGTTRRETGALQDVPVVGGVSRRLLGVGAETGQRLHEARESRYLPDDIRRELRLAGITYEPSAVMGHAGPVELRQTEMADVQKRTNDLTVERLRALFADPRWGRASKQAKERAVEAVTSDAREEARREGLQRIGRPEAEHRVQAAAGSR